MTLGAKIVRAIMRLIGSLPLGFHYAWSSAVAWILSSLLHYRKDVVMINLSRSFPEMKYKDVTKLCKQFYKHLADIFAEAVWFAGCRDYKRLKKQNIVRIDNWDVIEESFETAPGIVILDSHQGNWELLGGIMCYIPENSSVKLENMMVVYKKLSSKVWDEVFAANRCSVLENQDNMIESMSVLRYAVSHRDTKKIYVFPTDQSPYKKASIHKVNDFMHQKTVTMTGGAALAKLIHMSVFSMEMRVDTRGHYVIHFDKICDDASKYTPEEIMDVYYQNLQGYIEAQPWNYLWTHKRWKRRDAEEALLSK